MPTALPVSIPSFFLPPLLFEGVTVSLRQLVASVVVTAAGGVAASVATGRAASAVTACAVCLRSRQVAQRGLFLQAALSEFLFCRRLITIGIVLRAIIP